MLTLVPKSFCSWDYIAREGVTTIAALGFNYLSEQGRIEFAGTTYEVAKHGLMSGRWSLRDSARTVAEAHKPNALLRAFEVRIEARRLRLRTESAFAHSYLLESDAGWSGNIRPAHPLTRRAFIECSPVTPLLAQLFCFWLAALTWRRSAK